MRGRRLMHRRRLREGRRHHAGVLVTEHRMRCAFRRLVHAALKGRVALALVAFVVLVSVAR